MPLPRATPLLLSLPLTLPLAAPARAGELEIHFLNVGQGASTYVQGPDGTRVLIDGGNPGDGNAIVRPYLLSQGVTDLDYAVMTHWHTDHYGGMDEVFNGGFKPNIAAYDRGDFMKPSGNQASQYLSSVSGVRATPSLGQVIPLGDGATLQVVALNGQTLGGNVNLSGLEQFENASSIAMVIRYRDFDFYIAGDLTAGGNGTPNVEGPATNVVGQVEACQSSHHGSNTSSSTAVVNNLSPSFVMHSCGDQAEFGHPTQTTTNRWNSPSASRVQWCSTEGNVNSVSGGFAVADAHVQLRTDGRRFTLTRTGGDERVEMTTHENPGSPPGVVSLRLAEVMVNPAAASDGRGEWFEVINVSSSGTVDLGGVRFRRGSSSFTLASRVLLGFGDRLVVGLDGRPSNNGGVFLGTGAPWQDFSLPNTGTHELRIEMNDGTLIDSATWGSGGFPVVSGVSAERVDIFGADASSNFANATGALPGGDNGSPWETNDADDTDWPAVLDADPPAHIGGALTFELTAFDESNNFYFLGLSQGFFPPIQAFGFTILLAPDALFLAWASDPDAFGTLTAGRKVVSIPLPDDPALIGFSGFANYITLQFVPIKFIGSDQSNLESWSIGA